MDLLTVRDLKRLLLVTEGGGLRRGLQSREQLLEALLDARGIESAEREAVLARA